MNRQSRIGVKPVSLARLWAPLFTLAALAISGSLACKDSQSESDARMQPPAGESPASEDELAGPSELLAVDSPSIWLAQPRESSDVDFAHRYRNANLILISVDALQAAHVGSLGYPRNTTPSLDALSTCSFQFSSCYSVASWTVPAAMTWFTGVYPSEHQIVNKFAIYQPEQQRVANLQQLAPELITIAQILRERGYQTAGFTGNAGVSRVFGYDSGFERYDHELNKFGTFSYSIPRAIDWLESRSSEQPFFLFLHGYDAHGQAMPEEGFDYRFVPPSYDRRYFGAPQEQELLRETGLDQGVLKLRQEDIEFWRAIYDEKIQRADAKLEAFFRRLAQLNLLDNTIIVVTSDHGTEFCEHGRFDHGFTLYSEQIHVPLWIHLPRQSVGVDIQQPVSSIDLMPTLLDLLEVELSNQVTSQLQGTSLLGAMRGEPQTRAIFSETDYREFTFKRAIITPERWKLIYTLETRTRELYDLNLDPLELHNVADQWESVADDLEQQLFEHYRSIGHDLKARSWQPGYNPVYSFPKPE